VKFTDWLGETYGPEFADDTIDLHGWLEIAETVLDLPLFDNPQTLDAAAARSIVFHHPNNWHLTWTHTPSPHLTLWNTTPETPLPPSLHTTFTHQPRAHTWTLTAHHPRPHDTDTVHDTLTTLAQVLGPPQRVCLPWENIPTPPGLSDLQSAWKGETLHDLTATLTNPSPALVDELLEEADDLATEPATLIAYTLLICGAAPTPTEWTPSIQTETHTGLACMPPHAAPLRLLALLHELEQHGWIVLRDQCCGACIQDNLDTEMVTRGLNPHSPVITLWSDASGSILQPDGAVALTVPEPKDEKQAEQLYAAAEAHGMSLSEPADGRVTISAQN